MFEICDQLMHTCLLKWIVNKRFHFTFVRSVHVKFFTLLVVFVVWWISSRKVLEDSLIHAHNHLIHKNPSDSQFEAFHIIKTKQNAERGYPRFQIEQFLTSLQLQFVIPGFSLSRPLPFSYNQFFRLSLEPDCFPLVTTRHSRLFFSVRITSL